MKENTQNKMMVKVNENNIFYKIKNFLRKLFNKASNNADETMNTKETTIMSNAEINKNPFMEDIKNIENEETKLLELQKQYRAGEIKEEELTKEQVNALCALYDKQIESLRKSNEIRKQKLLEYRKKNYKQKIKLKGYR